MRRFALFCLTALLAVSFGCSRGVKRPIGSRAPWRIDWQDPVSVTRGFLRAKKAGDWQKAYRCCDYEETLPKAECKRIKEKWKEEYRRWPIDYANIYWIITRQDYRGQTAVVTILVSRRDPITHELKPGETYQEELKRYKDKWKITNPLVAETSE
jgi:hypothetical protein